MSQIKIPGATNGACNNCRHWEPTNIRFHGTKIIRLATWWAGFVHPCPTPVNDYSTGRPGDLDLCTPVLYVWTIFRLGNIATRICAPLSHTYELFFAWAIWRPGFVHPCPIPVNDFSPGQSGDQGLCTPVLYLCTIIRLGDLATRIFAPLSYTYERFFAWATWRPGFLHPCPIPMNNYSPWRPVFVHPYPIPMNDFSTGLPGDQDLCTLIPYLWTIFRLGYLASRICAPLSYTYERLDIHLNADDTNTEFYVKPRLWHNVGTSHWFVWIASKLSSVIHLLCAQQLHMISPIKMLRSFRSISLWHCAFDILIARERERVIKRIEFTIVVCFHDSR